MSEFGTVVTPDQIEDAAVDTIQAWFPSYLAELERRTGQQAGSIAPPRSYAVTNRFARDPQQQIPACIVISPGTVEQPVRRGDGAVQAWFRLEVGVAVSARTRAETNRLAKQYGGWLATMLLQQPDLGGVAAGVTLVGISNTEIPADVLEVGHCAICLFNVRVDEIANTLAGPTTPDVEPGDWPLVQMTHVDIERRSLTP